MIKKRKNDIHNRNLDKYVDGVFPNLANVWRNKISSGIIYSRINSPQIKISHEPNSVNFVKDTNIIHNENYKEQFNEMNKHIYNDSQPFSFKKSKKEKTNIGDEKHLCIHFKLTKKKIEGIIN